ERTWMRRSGNAVTSARRNEAPAIAAVPFMSAGTISKGAAGSNAASAAPTSRRLRASKKLRRSWPAVEEGASARGRGEAAGGVGGGGGGGGGAGREPGGHAALRCRRPSRFKTASAPASDDIGFWLVIRCRSTTTCDVQGSGA